MFPKTNVDARVLKDWFCTINHAASSPHKLCIFPCCVFLHTSFARVAHPFKSTGNNTKSVDKPLGNNSLPFKSTGTKKREEGREKIEKREDPKSKQA